jgi:hypothetical protein
MLLLFLNNVCTTIFSSAFVLYLLYQDKSANIDTLLLKKVYTTVFSVCTSRTGPCIRQHTSAYVRRCTPYSPSAPAARAPAYVRIRQHTSEGVNRILRLHQPHGPLHTSAYVSIRQHTSQGVHRILRLHQPHGPLARSSSGISICSSSGISICTSKVCTSKASKMSTFASLWTTLWIMAPDTVSIRYTRTHGSFAPEYVSIRQHTSAYVSIRQHMSAYVSICQHMSAYAERCDRAQHI